MKRTDASRRALAQRQREAMLAALTSNFLGLDPVDARRQVRELAARGISEETIAALAGWRLTDVRRALTEPQ